MAGNGGTWLEWLDIAGNGLRWLERARKAWIWLERAGNGWTQIIHKFLMFYFISK